jgi:iron complex transport system substrate-binding protein
MSARSTLAALVVLALATTACGIKSEPTGVLPAFPQTSADGFGREVEVNKAPMRIVSLDPGLSRTLVALGLGSRLVGLSGQEGKKFKHKAPVAMKSNGQPNVPQLRKLQPDLVLATPDVEPTPAGADALATAIGAEVYVSNPTSIRGIENDLQQIGALTDTRARAQQLVEGIAKEQHRVAGAVHGQQPVPVFVDLGFRNTIPANSLGANLIALAGGRNVAGQAPAGKPVPSHLLRVGAPQVYLVAASSGLNLKDLRRNKATRSLPAVRAGKVFVVPDSMLTEGGPGVSRALATIAHDLHPSLPAP